MARVVIIGAGPAGSAAAISLARRGVCAPGDITLVESKAFPRSKVCGEFLSPAVTELIELLVGARTLAAAGARKCERFVIELGDGERGWRMPTPAWSLSRRSLDELLRDAAGEMGVRILQPERVQKVEYGAKTVCVVLAGGGRVEADLVIHADGAGRHDSAGPTPNRRGVVAVKCHFRPMRPIDGVHIRSARGAYIGTVQIEGGLGTCAAVLKSSVIGADGGDIDAAMTRLWPGWSKSAREGEWLSCGVPASGYRRPGHPRSFRIGNAAEAVEPVGGEGIGLALWSGHGLAGMLGKHGMGDAGLAGAAGEFEREYHRRLALRRPACRIAAACLMRPAIVRAAWPLLRFPSLVIRPWYALTGKPLALGAGVPQE